MSYYAQYHQRFHVSQSLCRQWLRPVHWTTFWTKLLLYASCRAAKAYSGLLLVVLTAMFSGMLSSCRWKQQSNGQDSTTTSTATISAEASSASVPALNKRVVVNESTLILRLSRQFPERIVGSMSMEELIRSLYATQMRLDERDTLVISDVQIVPLHSSNASTLYVALAVSQRLPSGGRADASNTQKRIDVFLFHDTTSAKFVLGYTTVEPEYEDFSLENPSAHLYQITRSGEYALSFEVVSALPPPHAEAVRMLYLYRVHEDIARAKHTKQSAKQALEPLFEYCTAMKTGESPRPDGSFEIQITDTASISTRWTWNKELYSLVIIKTEMRKGDVDAGAGTTRSRKYRLYYDWNNGKYEEVIQQDLGRSTF